MSRSTEPARPFTHKISKPEDPAAAEITYDDFAKVDIRAGVIVTADTFPEARKPAYRLSIDFGPAIGVKKSSAQITELYSLDDLIGLTVMAVVNFLPRQIGPMRSEVLVLGFPDAEGRITLAAPLSQTPKGARLA